MCVRASGGENNKWLQITICCLSVEILHKEVGGRDPVLGEIVEQRYGTV